MKRKYKLAWAIAGLMGLGASQHMLAASFLTKLDLQSMYGYGHIGGHQINIDDLNSRLRSNGYSAIPNEPFIDFGLGGAIILNGLVLGGEAAFLAQKDANSTKGGVDYRNSLSAGYVIGKGGFVLWESTSVKIIPYAGFGFSGMSLLITPKGSRNFNNVLSNPGQGTLASRGSLFSVFGLELFGRLPLLTMGSKDIGILGGAQGGYGLAFAESDWVLGGVNDRASLNNGPSANITGWYARIIGGAYIQF